MYCFAPRVDTTVAAITGSARNSSHHSQPAVTPSQPSEIAITNRNASWMRSKRAGDLTSS